MLEQIGSVHPWSINYDHCSKFMQIFDTNGDGVLQLDEYIKLVRYVIAMAAWEYYGSQQQQPEEAPQEMTEEQVIVQGEIALSE